MLSSALVFILCLQKQKSDKRKILICDRLKFLNINLIILSLKSDFVRLSNGRVIQYIHEEANK